MQRHRERLDRLNDETVHNIIGELHRLSESAELAEAEARLERSESKLREAKLRLVREQLLRTNAEQATASRADEARSVKAELATAVRALRKARDEGRRNDEERRRATRAFEEARDRLVKYHEELKVRDARAAGKEEGRTEVSCGERGQADVRLGKRPSCGSEVVMRRRHHQRSRRSCGLSTRAKSQQRRCTASCNRCLCPRGRSSKSSKARWFSQRSSQCHSRQLSRRHSPPSRPWHKSSRRQSSTRRSSITPHPSSGCRARIASSRSRPACRSPTRRHSRTPRPTSSSCPRRLRTRPFRSPSRRPVTPPRQTTHPRDPALRDSLPRPVSLPTFLRRQYASPPRPTR